MHSKWRKKKGESLFGKVKLFCYLFQEIDMPQDNNDRLIYRTKCSLFFNMVSVNDNANAVLAIGNPHGPCFY